MRMKLQNMHNIFSFKQISFFIFSIILFSGCSPINIPGPHIETVTEYQEREPVYVSKVVDGDTIHYFRKSKTRDGYDEKTVYKGRLIGINTPESTSKIELFGLESTNYLKDLIENKEITIERDMDLHDNYNRELIHVFFQDENLNEALVKNGFARVAYLYNDYKFIDRYKAAESVAKEQELGIWSIPGYVETNSNGFNMDVID